MEALLCATTVERIERVAKRCCIIFAIVVGPLFQLSNFVRVRGLVAAGLVPTAIVAFNFYVWIGPLGFIAQGMVAPVWIFVLAESHASGFPHTTREILHNRNVVECTKAIFKLNAKCLEFSHKALFLVLGCTAFLIVNAILIIVSVASGSLTPTVIPLMVGLMLLYVTGGVVTLWSLAALHDHSSKLVEAMATGTMTNEIMAIEVGDHDGDGQLSVDESMILQLRQISLMQTANAQNSGRGMGFMLISTIVTPQLVQSIATFSYSVLAYIWQGSQINHQPMIIAKLAEVASQVSNQGQILALHALQMNTTELNNLIADQGCSVSLPNTTLCNVTWSG